MAAIAYIYVAECKCNSTCERKRKVTKNQGLRGGERKLLSPEVRSYYLLVLIRNAFPIYIYRDILYSREVALINGRISIICPRERRALVILIKSISGLLERQSWLSTGQPGRTWKMHQGGVVPIYRRYRQVAECVRNAKRGEERFQPANVSLRDRGQKIRPDETTEIKREK